jgi:glycosyltransferase involved in cell wall biosynthesis
MSGNTASKNPVVSIGLPVFNGEPFLSETLDSILGQSFTDFELLISDNASTDGTEEICRTNAKSDKRIRYFRNQQNVGAAENYNRVFHLASGKYFKWAAHDDICAPTFLSKCVSVLEENPEIILCYSLAKAIDESGRAIKDYPAKSDAGSNKPYRRFHEFVCIPHPCVAVFGLIRSNSLRQTKLIGNYASSDRPLLSELSLRGPFFEIPEYLFFYRNHPQQSWKAHESRRAVEVWFDPERGDKVTFPHWRLLWEFARSIQSVPLNFGERVATYASLLWWMRRNWKHLLLNLVFREA